MWWKMMEIFAKKKKVEKDTLMLMVVRNPAKKPPEIGVKPR